MDSNGAVTVAEAAEMCSVSDDTIRRRLQDGSMPGAVRTSAPNGPWRIPISDLIAAGLSPALGEFGRPTSGPKGRRPSPQHGVMEQHISVAELQSALLEVRERAVRAEALAEAHAEHASALLLILAESCRSKCAQRPDSEPDLETGVNP